MNRTLEISLLSLGIALIWAGVILYIYPFILWSLPSIFIGAVFIFSGAIIFATDIIFIAREKCNSKPMFLAILIVAIVLIFWGFLYLIPFIRSLL